MFKKPVGQTPSDLLARYAGRPDSTETRRAAEGIDSRGQEASAAPEARRPDPARVANAQEEGSRLIVGSNIKLKGVEITDCDVLVVEGRVEAAMDSRIIRIAESGTFVGTASIDVAEIRGRFEGELTARKKLVVHATGKISGKVRYGKVSIEDGGEICGDVAALASRPASAASAPAHSEGSPAAGDGKPGEKSAQPGAALTTPAGKLKKWEPSS